MVYLFGFICLGVCLALVALGKHWFDCAEGMFENAKKMNEIIVINTESDRVVRKHIYKLLGIDFDKLVEEARKDEQTSVSEPTTDR